MFRYEEPQFQRKRVLRVEMLEQLRDYPRNYLQLRLRGYADGILCGCELSWDHGQLTIAPGILYHAQKLYFMESPYSIACGPKDCLRYLKVQFLAEVQEAGKVEGDTRILLEEKTPDPACEMELARFRLQEGARLRDTYENFEDYVTEFDTINRLYTPYAAYQEATLWPVMLKQFAVEMLEYPCKDPYDISFAMNVLANEGDMPMSGIRAYLQVRLSGQTLAEGPRQIFGGFRTILRQIRSGQPIDTSQKETKKKVMLL